MNNVLLQLHYAHLNIVNDICSLHYILSPSLWTNTLHAQYLENLHAQYPASNIYITTSMSSPEAQKSSTVHLPSLILTIVSIQTTATYHHSFL